MSRVPQEQGLSLVYKGLTRSQVVVSSLRKARFRLLKFRRNSTDRRKMTAQMVVFQDFMANINLAKTSPELFLSRTKHG